MMIMTMFNPMKNKRRNEFLIIGVLFLILSILGNEGLSLRFYATFVPAIVFLILSLVVGLKK